MSRKWLVGLNVNGDNVDNLDFYVPGVGTQMQLSKTGVLKVAGKAVNGPNVLAGSLGTPASSTAACVAGATAADATYFYVCTSTDTWKRATLAAF
jgi:hypothetical protein